MLLLRLAIGLAVAYLALVLLAWRFQERIAFPAPRAPLPHPADVGLAHGERVEVVTASGTRLAGWFLPPSPSAPVVRGPSPSLLWFYGNGENIASIWPVLRDFQPPGIALLVLDYPGYGASEGAATEPGVYEAADAAYAYLRGRADVDGGRIYVYGRSLGTAVASYAAARHPVAGLVLESPFTNAGEMSGQHYGVFPRFILRLRLDNLAQITRVRCPVLVFHGTADRLVPSAMGRRVAAAAPGPVELVLIEGAGHNETYDVGGRAYRDKLWEFVLRAR
jgi:pimeloyl-ACP methyl ester carboxylesterase